MSTPKGVCPVRRVDGEGKPFCPVSYPMREDIPKPPPYMAHLPVDERGYPVPFFVSWPDDKPEFRAVSVDTMALCLKKNLCWVCGRGLGKEAVFTIGPMCSVNRVSAEPPAHIACARYSVISCPFMTKPQMVRREFDDPRKIAPAGIQIMRNPGAMLLWFASTWKVKKVQADGPVQRGMLFEFPANPTKVEWYFKGRAATREEVLDSINSGLPLLEAQTHGEAAKALLARQVERAMKLVPR